jgi:hypothetical protein
MTLTNGLTVLRAECPDAETSRRCNRLSNSLQPNALLARLNIYYNGLMRFEEYAGGDTRSVSTFNPHLEYNGALLLSQPMRWEHTKHTSDFMYADDLGELNGLFDGLVQEGSIPSAVWKLMPDTYVKTIGPGIAVPDFRVRLLTGEEFFLEVTQAGESDVMRLENTTRELSHALATWFLGTAGAQAHLDGLHLTFLPQRHFAAREQHAALEELKRFAVRQPLGAYERFGIRINSSQYPTLTAASTIPLVQKQSYIFGVSVHTPAFAFDPSAQNATVLDAINSKIAKGYEHFRPIRLVVALQHVIGKVSDIFEDVKRDFTDLGPFDRVYVANSNVLLVAKQ